jgi:hypothetical protein
MKDTGRISDQVTATITREDGTVPKDVKGPDPEQWGENANRPKQRGQRPRAVDGKVKGPDPSQWGDTSKEQQS